MVSSKPPPEPVFFCDRDLGRVTFPGVLREAGLDVVAHDDHFGGPEPVADETWLEEVAERGWVGVTHDARIRTTSRLRDHVMQVGARLLVVRGKAPSLDLATAFVATLPSIRRFLRRHRDPLIARVRRHPHVLTQRGTIEMWLSYEEWDAERRGPLR